MGTCPDHWTRSTVGSICKVVRGSSPRPIADQRYFDCGTIPWIKIADATKSGKYLYGTRERVNDFGASFSRFLPAGSLIVAASGTLGYTQMLGVPGCIHDGWLHLSDFVGVEKHFLYYWLKCQAEHFTNSAYGAAIQNINTAIMRESEIDLPPLDEQRRIASILSAYDDLIENNTRRIAILEEMARCIYEEWFVRFRFPGHEGVPMVESELGRVPEGWDTVRLEEVCTRITDGSHSSPKSMPSGKPMASVKDMHDWGINRQSCRLISEEDYDQLVRNDCKPRLNDVLIAKDGSYLKHTFVVDEETDLVVLSSIAILRPNGRLLPNQLALYLRLPDVASRMRGYVSGVAIPRIVLSDFRRFMVLLAPKPMQEAWAMRCDPMLALCRNLVRQNDRLRKTRDLLLPKLVSGELDVSALPEPEAAAA